MGGVAALGAQLRFDQFPFGFGVGFAELGEQAFDPGLGVLQLFAGADGRCGDVVGRLVAYDLADPREGRHRVVELAARDQQFEGGVAPVLPLCTLEWRTMPWSGCTAS